MRRVWNDATLADGIAGAADDASAGRRNRSKPGIALGVAEGEDYLRELSNWKIMG